MDELTEVLKKVFSEPEWTVYGDRDGSIIVIRSYPGQRKAPKLITFTPSLEEKGKVFFIEVEDSDGSTITL